jgi:hypothetical protein
LGESSVQSVHFSNLVLPTSVSAGKKPVAFGRTFVAVFILTHHVRML